MKTTAVRLYGADDIRLETFDLPEITEEEVQIRVVSDTICASTYKAVKQGTRHKRVPPDVAEHPIIIGHELCGVVEEVGERLAGRFAPGDTVVIQPALKLESGYDPGYSYPTVGGDTIHAVVPPIVIERDCLIRYNGDGFYKGSLVESLGCCLRAIKGMYHIDPETYVRTDGVRKGGKAAILGGAGPMGLGLAELLMCSAGTGQITVTDVDAKRLASAAKRCPSSRAARSGVQLDFVDTSKSEDPVAMLRELSDGGFDDVFVMAPVPALLSQAEAICREDGCINFFAGPAVHELQGGLNLYRIHYDSIHLLGTAGSIPADTREIIGLIQSGTLDPSSMISHICGLSSVIDGVRGMGKPNGLKKVCYTELNIPMIHLDDLPELGKQDALYRELARLVEENNGTWSPKAERYLLAHAPRMPE